VTPSDADVPRLFLRPKEAARILGIGRTQLYAMLAADEIDGVVRLGPRCILIDVDALDRWKQRQLAAALHDAATRRRAPATD
jgi:excisionase family DNA binding protein